jgi:Ca2+-binding RTX toxin-like protein
MTFPTPSPGSAANTEESGMRRLAFIGTIVAVLAFAVTATAQVPAPTCFGQPATIGGSSGPDTIRGTTGDDVIKALGGDDLVLGDPQGSADDGNDLICLGPGADTAVGDSNDFDNESGDTVEGDDKINGGPGDDPLIVGENGDDVIMGLGGDDGGLYGDTFEYDAPEGDGSDLVVGGKGAEDLIGGDYGSDVLRGAAGADTLDAQDGVGSELVNGGEDADACATDPDDIVRKCEGEGFRAAAQQQRVDPTDRVTDLAR